MAAALLWVAAAALLYLTARVVRFYRRVWRMHRLTADIPGPAPYPLIGNVHRFLTPLDRMYQLMDSLCADFGYLFKFWIGPCLGVAVLDPEDLQVVLTSPALASKPDEFYECLMHVVGRGLITLNGSDYKRHRKAITASMHYDILQEFVTMFGVNCRELEARLDPLAETGEVFDVLHDLGRCASLSVCRTVLAAEAPGLEAERDAFVQIVHDASKVMLYRGLRPWFRSRLLFKLSSWYERYYQVVEGGTNFADKVLTQKTQMLQQTAPTTPAPAAHRRQTFLDTFLSSTEASVLTRAELLDELKTMLFAGIGTSMDFQSMFLLCMSLYPDMQRKVQQELDDVFGSDRDRDIVASDLPHMKYLECALKEALRFFPSVPVFARVASQDVPLPSGRVIPEGCYVGVFPLWTHRHPKYFPDPERFDPERFTPENSRDRHPFAFIPFSTGLRSCIGQRFAMMFAKTVAASVLRRYDVLPDPDGPRRLVDVPLVGGISLSVKGGVKVRLRRRGPHGLEHAEEPPVYGL
ncbi:cytochrome P450 4C1-like [Thrips palmi]|uniref:Cytochrome P450 4C1-like n=1 Tax=Thrips palmi TaxID=161013 RepID=A0A6P8YEP9_THRPL|nr:cytochrome P450 4C1-like [Thrips palmi]